MGPSTQVQDGEDGSTRRSASTASWRLGSCTSRTTLYERTVEWPRVAAVVNRPHGRFERVAHGLPHHLTACLELVEQVAPVRERRILA